MQEALSVACRVLSYSAWGCSSSRTQWIVSWVEQAHPYKRYSFPASVPALLPVPLFRASAPVPSLDLLSTFWALSHCTRNCCRHMVSQPQLQYRTSEFLGDARMNPITTVQQKRHRVSQPIFWHNQLTEGQITGPSIHTVLASGKRAVLSLG